MSESPVQIVLADDHRIVTDGICKLISEKRPEWRIRQIFQEGDSLLKYVDHDGELIDLLIIDIRMPGKNGIELTREIKEKYPGIHILVLSMYDREGYINGSIDAGADGYMLKDEGGDKLLEAIESILEGHKWFSQRVTDQLVTRIRRDPSSDQVFLTSREQSVLQLLADGYTSEQVGDELAMSKHTADTFRRNLIHKFEARNVGELIKKAFMRGYLID